MYLSSLGKNSFMLQTNDETELKFIHEAQQQSYDLLKNGMCINAIMQELASCCASNQGLSKIDHDTHLDEISLMYTLWKLKNSGFNYNKKHLLLFQYKNRVEKNISPDVKDYVQWFLVPIHSLGDVFHRDLEIYANYAFAFPFASGWGQNAGVNYDVCQNGFSEEDRREIKLSCQRILFAVDSKICEKCQMSYDKVGVLLPFKLEKRTGLINDDFYETIITK